MWNENKQSQNQILLFSRGVGGGGGVVLSDKLKMANARNVNRIVIKPVITNMQCLQVSCIYMSYESKKQIADMQIIMKNSDLGGKVKVCANS